MKDNFNNSFKKTYEPLEVPPEIKKRVMKEIGLLQLIGSVGDLFTNKMGKSGISLFKNKNNK